MEGLTVTAFAFSMIAIAAFGLVIMLTRRVEKLIKTLKEKGILDENYKDD